LNGCLIEVETHTVNRQYLGYHRHLYREANAQG
jgi:hypothetical protein